MILVTGATGLVGSQICRELKSGNIPFRALKRHSSSIPPDLLNEDWVVGDILDFESITDALKEITIVIHSAAMISFYKGDYKLMEKINVEGTKNVVNACLGSFIKKFIHISSIAAIGRTINYSTIDEKTQWVQSPNNSYYGETKYLAELEVWRAIEEGLPATIINPSIVLGVGDWSNSSTRLFKYAWEEHRYFPSGSMNYVDNRDVASIVLKLVDANISGERYILNGGCVSYKSFFEQAAKSYGRTPPTTQLPSKYTFLVIWLAKVKSFLTRTKPFVTREALLGVKKEYSYDASKIKKLLNFAFRDLEESIGWVCSKIKKE